MIDSISADVLYHVSISKLTLNWVDYDVLMRTGSTPVACASSAFVAVELELHRVSKSFVSIPTQVIGSWSG